MNHNIIMYYTIFGRSVSLWQYIYTCSMNQLFINIVIICFLLMSTVFYNVLQVRVKFRQEVALLCVVCDFLSPFN